ncbi:hypothetical protein GE118_00235 [Mycoplasma sp. NEAQ87857]|uniref:hypothetical protein n=1 Tax=Mycoplasma sp. NEAQ87857 TaxID=2683967 RepID=UPI001316C935|nr:hypothetical protein [Mycoplasma sp. NEAQ87857]QGZ97231.1 hypothetical protein GE118_00235 [Mycoplasma sp. NEAQ87857]
MKKNKKILTSLLTVGTTLAVAGLSVSCAKANPFSTSKEILIAVDGAQQKMYDKAEELFKQTESYKKGYRIKRVNKGVFDALNFGASTVGVTDPNQVPDIFTHHMIELLI